MDIRGKVDREGRWHAKAVAVGQEHYSARKHLHGGRQVQQAGNSQQLATLGAKKGWGAERRTRRAEQMVTWYVSSVCGTTRRERLQFHPRRARQSVRSARAR